jgi:MarR family transcriptional regulator, organic hydroperoxide resistance regulator
MQQRYAARVDPLYELALLIKAGQRELERRTNEVMQPLGLTGAQADAIAVLAQAGPLSLKELGELLIAEAGHPSRLVDRLVAAGLVDRRPADDDRRRIELSLTANGRSLEKQIQRARADLFALARSLIGDRDLQPVLDFLRDLTQYSSFRDLVERRRELDEGAGVTE